MPRRSIMPIPPDVPELAESRGTDEGEVRDRRESSAVSSCVPRSQPVPLQPSFSMPSGSIESEPEPVRGVSCVRLQRDQVLQLASEALGHVEVVITRLVRHEVIADRSRRRRTRTSRRGRQRLQV